MNRAKERMMSDPRFQDVQRSASDAMNDAMSKGADAMNKGAESMNKGAGALEKGTELPRLVLGRTTAGTRPSHGNARPHGRAFLLVSRVSAQIDPPPAVGSYAAGVT